MAAVVAMLHAGVRCAFPAQQVVLAEAAAAPADVGVLWTGDSALEGGTPALHRVRLSAGAGERWLHCARPRLVELDGEHVWPLTDFLEQILDTPFIIGVVEIEGDLHWMIDAHRLMTIAVGS